jgi:hypothetical protein
MSTNPFVRQPNLQKSFCHSLGHLCRINRDSSFDPDSVFPAETSPATLPYKTKVQHAESAQACDAIPYEDDGLFGAGNIGRQS